MSFSRRRFLGVGTLAGLGLAACGPGERERPLGDLSDLDQGTFTPEVGSAFQLMSGSGLFESLTLTGVRDLRRKDAQHQGEVFALEFQGPLDKPLRQDVYRLEHARLGGMTLLLVPLMPNPEALRYEAVFNRMIG
jgi:hypothetical protein